MISMFDMTRMMGLLLACTCVAGNALAQKYPTKTVRIIVP